MADLTPYTPPNITDEDKTWGAIMYAFPFMGAITLFGLKDKLSSQYVHFHAIQSTALLVVLLIISFISCGFLAWVPLLICAFTAWKAYQGEMFELPVITDQLANRGKFDPVKQLPG